MKTLAITALFGLSLAASIHGHPEGYVGLSATLCCLYFLRCRRIERKRIWKAAPLSWPRIVGGYELKAYRERF